MWNPCFDISGNCSQTPDGATGKASASPGTRFPNRRIAISLNPSCRRMPMGTSRSSLSAMERSATDGRSRLEVFVAGGDGTVWRISQTR